RHLVAGGEDGGGWLAPAQQVGHAPGATVHSELDLGVQVLVQRDVGRAERLPVPGPAVHVHAGGELVVRVAGEGRDPPVAERAEVFGRGTRGGDVVDPHTPP